ncbi:hypothetical protein UlMin_002321 [Ulmus minor]
MEPMKGKINSIFSSAKKSSVGNNNGGSSVGDLEVRPGGLLVQKRNSDMNPSSVFVPTIRVRVKYGSTYHNICISSQASFGDLKKKLAGPTGLNHQDQKLIFKNKERDSKSFLDIAGVKDGSKMVMEEDIVNREKRFLENFRIAVEEKASKSLANINLEVDKLQGKVTAMEATICRGGKVAEINVDNLIEILMSKLIALDGIVADGELKQQRRTQVIRVQKCIETLDVVKLQSSISSSTKVRIPIPQQENSTREKPKPGLKMQQPLNQGNYRAKRSVFERPNKQSEQLVVSTKWETFD